MNRSGIQSLTFVLLSQNKFVMGCGLFAITFCSAYIYYWRQQATKDPNSYIALQEDGTEVVRKTPASRWD